MFRRSPTVPKTLVYASDVSWRLLVVLAAISLVGYILVQLKVIVLPLIIALFLASLLMTPVDSLVKKGLNRSMATMAVLLASLLIVIGIGSLMGPIIARDVSGFQKGIGQSVEQLGGLASSLPIGVSTEQIESTIEQSSQWVEQNRTRIIGGVYSGAVLFVEIFAGILLTLVILFFYLKDGRNIWQWCRNFFPKNKQSHIQSFGKASWSTLSAYLKGISITALVNAVLSGVVLWLLGVPLVLPLMVLIFIGSFLPIIGAFLTGLLAVLIALAFQGPLVALLVLAAFVVIQQLEGNVVYPIVVGRKVQLHPLATLLLVTSGAVLFGIAGAFLAVPLAAIVSPVISKQSVTA